MRFPFEVGPDELRENLDSFVDAIFSTLESEFLVMPRGEGFVNYSEFEAAFEALKKGSRNFETLAEEHVVEIARKAPLVIVVLRAMLGFTPSEWAYVASRHSALELTQSYVRNLDRRIRMNPGKAIRSGNGRIEALVRSACELLSRPAPEVGPDKIHRLAKADTEQGLKSIRRLSSMGTPYPMLLYERVLGRPFASHRDSVSEIVGGRLEVAIEEKLTEHGVSFRKTKRAESVPGFDQAPDFVVPDEHAPSVVIEAKVTEDDGTARDKVTRVQHLASLSRGSTRGSKKFGVVACIAGRGFGVRREDMRKLLLATDGKVFTLKTLDRLVKDTALRKFASSAN